MAKVIGRALPVSTKYSIEVSSMIRGREVSTARKMLQEVMVLRRPVPHKRFKRDIPHKRKVGTGSYPIKVATEVVKLLDAVEANAQFKGLNTAHLIIAQIIVNKAGNQWHYGRQRRRQMKRTHIEIVVQEAKKSKEDRK